MKTEPIELSDEERQHLVACINLAIKSSENAINAAKILTPIADKLSEPRPSK